MARTSGTETVRTNRSVVPNVGAVLTRVITFAISGIESRRVEVEVDVRSGLPGFTIVGLGDRAVREARERVQAA